MADTLLTLAQERLAQADTDADDARAALADANQEIDDAREELERLGADLAELNEAAAADRKALAETTDHAEGEALLESLDANRRAQHRAAADVVERRIELDNARAAAARASAHLQRAQGAIDKGTLALADAEAAEARRANWRAAADILAGTLVPAADALKAGTTFTDARTRIEAEVPSQLRTAGRARAGQLKTLMGNLATAVTDTETDLHDAHDATGGLTGDVLAAAILFARAERALGELAGRANADLANTRTVLEGIKKDPPLSAAVLQRIADLAADGAPAVGQLDAKRTARDNALSAANAAQAVLDDLLARKAAGEAGLDAQITAAQNDLGTKQTALNTAQDELDEVQTAVDAWVSAVPDAAWRRFASFEESSATLDRLHAINATTIKTDAVNAEKTYAQALTQADADARTIEDAAAAAEEARRQLTAAEQARPARLIAALRGDRN